MIVEKKEQGYYCTRCKTTYALFQNIPKECYFGECTPTKGDIVRENYKTEDMKLASCNDNLFDGEDLEGVPKMR